MDFAQAAIAPPAWPALFTRSARMLEADGSPMSVRFALIKINRTLDETLARQEGDLDPDHPFLRRLIRWSSSASTFLGSITN